MLWPSRPQKSGAPGGFRGSSGQTLLPERGQGQREEVDLVKVTQLTKGQATIGLQAGNLGRALGKREGKREPLDQVRGPGFLPPELAESGATVFPSPKGL